MDCSKLKTEGGDYTVDEVLDKCPKCFLIDNTDRERVQVKDGVLYCKFAAPTPPTPTDPDSDDDSGVVVDIDPAAKSALEKKYHRLNLKTYAKDSALDSEFKKLYQDLRKTNMYVSKLLRVQHT